MKLRGSTHTIGFLNIKKKENSGCHYSCLAITSRCIEIVLWVYLRGMLTVIYIQVYCNGEGENSSIGAKCPMFYKQFLNFPEKCLRYSLRTSNHSASAYFH